MVICDNAQAVALQCTNSPLVNIPNSIVSFTDNNFHDSFMLNDTQVATIESVNGATVKRIPTSLWYGAMTKASFIDQDGSEVNANVTINYDNIEFRSPDDGSKYRITSALIHHIDIYSVHANNLKVVIKNKATGQESTSLNLPYTVITPGVTAQWVLPDQKDIGEIHPGEIMNFTLPGPEGASGRVRGLSIIGDREVINVNGCGTGCSADIADGGLIEIMANAENGIPEGKYGLNVEATLLCD